MALMKKYQWTIFAITIVEMVFLDAIKEFNAIDA